MKIEAIHSNKLPRRPFLLQETRAILPRRFLSRLTLLCEAPAPPVLRSWRLPEPRIANEPGPNGWRPRARHHSPRAKFPFDGEGRPSTFGVGCNFPQIQILGRLENFL